MSAEQEFIYRAADAVDRRQAMYSDQLSVYVRRCHYLFHGILILLACNHVSPNSLPLWIAFLMLAYMYVRAYTILILQDEVNAATCAVNRELEYAIFRRIHDTKPAPAAGE